jgi:hypothetical protein
MKSTLKGIMATTVLWCGCLVAQESVAPATGAIPPGQQSAASAPVAPSGPALGNAVPRIAPGSVIPVQLTKTIDVKKLKPGDEVDAKVTTDLKAGNGDIVVPKDTKVVGRVTEAQARSKEQKESQVGIAFDHAVMKSGGDMTLPMSVQAIISPSYLSGGNSGGSSESSGQPSSTPGAGTSPGYNGRTGAAGTQQSSTPSSSASSGTSDEPNAKKARQPITGETQGVLGFENLKLSSAPDATKGSVLSSEKDNVKLESGTMMLLRVN